MPEPIPSKTNESDLYSVIADALSSIADSEVEGLMSAKDKQILSEAGAVLVRLAAEIEKRKPSKSNSTIERYQDAEAAVRKYIGEAPNGRKQCAVVLEMALRMNIIGRLNGLEPESFVNLFLNRLQMAIRFNRITQLFVGLQNDIREELTNHLAMETEGNVQEEMTMIVVRSMQVSRQMPAKADLLFQLLNRAFEQAGEGTN